MPKNKFQEVIFTIIMVFFMVYAMICYNIALNKGGMTNEVFLLAFHELVIMGPIAFILDFFLYGHLAKKIRRIIQNRKHPKIEPMIDGYSGFLFLDKNDMPMVALHWEKYFQHIREKYNSIYKIQMPCITPHGRVIIRTS